MNKVKITVLKTEFYEDLAREYGREELGPCAAMQVGKVYYADVKCPAGFCNTAWNCIYQYVFALANGAGKPLGMGTAPVKAVWETAKKMGIPMVVES